MSKFFQSRLFTFVCVALVVAAVLHRLFAPADVASFEVASWNMRWFPAGYMEIQPPERELERIGKTALLMREQGIPDILFAQEIRDMKTCETLASHLNDPAFKPVVCSEFTVTIDRTNRVVALQQIAIFSRFNAIESGAEPWHVKDLVTPPRGYVYAVLEVGTNLVAVFNVHLKSNFIPRDQDEARETRINRLKREFACRQLLDAVDSFREKDYDGRRIAGFIVGGDFNHSLYEERFDSENSMRAILGAGFANVFDGRSTEEWQTLAANQWYPWAIFDYLFAEGVKPIEGTQKVLTEHRWFGISDHLQIRARFGFKQ